jgi:radical SAM superfamily enzyme YgiQ (UPF0313 family)
MKVLLINPPQEEEITYIVPEDYNIRARENYSPLGLMYLYSHLIAQHDVSIVDMSARRMGIADIVSILDQYKPDVVGLTCVISKWISIIKLAKYIKDYGAIVVVGGANPSLYTYETLQCEDVDFVIRGFGQVPFLELCNQLEDGRHIKDIRNCFTRDNYPNKTPGVFELKDLDQFPFPRRDVLSLDDYNMSYFTNHPTTSLLTSLGCPHRCAFCPCRILKPVTIRKSEKVIEEMRVIQSLGIKSVLVLDELFAMSNHRVSNTCSEIINSDIELDWAVKARASPLSVRSLELMKQAGCCNIHMGIESGCDRILQKMNKKIVTKQIRKAVKRIKDAGISCSANFMLGYPSETEKEIMETINFAIELELDMCQFCITIPVPDTELYKEWQDNSDYVGDIFSDFTLSPDKVFLDDIIASDIFTKEQLAEFSDFAYSQTSNLYKINQSSKR